MDVATMVKEEIPYLLEDCSPEEQEKMRWVKDNIQSDWRAVDSLETSWEDELQNLIYEVMEEAPKGEKDGTDTSRNKRASRCV